MRRSLAVRRALGKAQASSAPLLRERHTLALNRCRAQFLFVHCSKIGNFEAVRRHRPVRRGVDSAQQAGTIRFFY
jgi:hypothetical protein